MLPWKECGECRFCAADNENRRLVAQVSMAQNMPLFPNSLNSPTGDPQIQIMVPNESTESCNVGPNKLASAPLRGERRSVAQRRNQQLHMQRHTQAKEKLGNQDSGGGKPTSRQAGLQNKPAVGDWQAKQPRLPAMKNWRSSRKRENWHPIPARPETLHIELSNTQ